MPISTEKVNMPAGFTEVLFDAPFAESFEAWNMLRRGRVNVLSITVDRKDGIHIETARSSNDVKRVDGQCKDLLYGSSRICEQSWMSVDRNVVAIRVDVRQPYVTYVRSATE